MRVLDLFCGVGGAAMGYHLAWPDAEIVGVDITPQPDYPFEFVQADATTYPLGGFDFIHASPPCQGETSVRAIHQDRTYERLLIPTLTRLAELDVPWIVENVENADAPAHIYKVRLCGSAFGLRVRRHRWFWTNQAVLVPGCSHGSQIDVVGVYGSSDGTTSNGRGPRQATTIEAREVMGMPWATKRRGITNAIPPAYTRYLAEQLTAAVAA